MLLLLILTQTLRNCLRIMLLKETSNHWGVTTKRPRLSFRDKENILKLDYGDSPTALQILIKITELYTLRGKTLQCIKCIITNLFLKVTAY